MKNPTILLVSLKNQDKTIDAEFSDVFDGKPSEEDIRDRLNKAGIAVIEVLRYGD